MFDVTSLGTKEDLTNGAWLEYENPKTGEIQLRIKLSAMDGKIGEALAFEQADKRLKKADRGQASIPSAAQLAAKNIQLLAKLTLEWESKNEKGEWEPFIYFNGDAISCTYTNAVYLYTNVPPLFDLVNAFVRDNENFAPKGSPDAKAMALANEYKSGVEGNSQSGLNGDSATPA